MLGLGASVQGGRGGRRWPATRRAPKVARTGNATPPDGASHADRARRVRALRTPAPMRTSRNPADRSVVHRHTQRDAQNLSAAPAASSGARPPSFCALVAPLEISRSRCVTHLALGASGLVVTDEQATAAAGHLLPSAFTQAMSRNRARRSPERDHGFGLLIQPVYADLEQVLGYLTGEPLVDRRVGQEDAHEVCGPGRRGARGAHGLPTVPRGVVGPAGAFWRRQDHI